MAIQYVTGDATAPLGSGPRVLVHVCNDVGKWGKGFVLAISRRWKLPEQQFKAWYRGETGRSFALGEVQFVEVERAFWVANLVGQRGLASKHRGEPAVRYEAVRGGLAKVRGHALAERASVHMPRIGCGLAGGRWNEIEPIIESELSMHGVDVNVYDIGTVR
ncbi:MAG TPA: macro domain-containing protein [Kofleriaceae bacterium]